MTDQLPISRQMTLPGMSESISLPASADGTSPCNSPNGLSAVPSGPAVVLVRRSAKPESVRVVSDARARTLCGALDELATAYAQIAVTHGLPTAATYGRRPGASSNEVARLSSLESRLRAQTDLNGSPEYALRWKSSPMLLGAPIIRLRASARRISDSDFSGWPTPDAQAFNANSDIEKTNARIERLKAKGINGNGAGYTLGSAAQLVGWPTPQSRDGANNRGGMEERTGGQRRNLDDYAMLAGWNTPRVSDKNGPRETDDKRGVGLNTQASLTGWSTPSSRDWKDTPGMATTAVNPDGSTRTRVDQLPRQALLASGTALTSSTAQTGKRAASLNPRFSGWLMGYPPAWCEAALKVPKASRSRKAPATASDGSADTATPSTPTRRRGSSVLGGK